MVIATTGNAHVVFVGAARLAASKPTQPRSSTWISAQAWLAAAASADRAQVAADIARREAQRACGGDQHVRVVLADARTGGEGLGGGGFRVGGVGQVVHVVAHAVGTADAGARARCPRRRACSASVDHGRSSAVGEFGAAQVEHRRQGRPRSPCTPCRSCVSRPGRARDSARVHRAVDGMGRDRIAEAVDAGRCSVRPSTVTRHRARAGRRWAPATGAAPARSAGRPRRSGIGVVEDVQLHAWYLSSRLGPRNELEQMSLGDLRAQRIAAVDHVGEVFVQAGRDDLVDAGEAQVGIQASAPGAWLRRQALESCASIASRWW